MRHVIYKNRTSRKHQRRIVSINEYNQDKDVKTRVQKSFLYHVTAVVNNDVSEHPPAVYIQKHVDTKKQIEEFCFRVKGSFVTARGKDVLRIDFVHKLKIFMQWNDKQFSPKKSVTLT